MKTVQKPLLWCILLAGLTGLFYLSSPDPAGVSADEGTSVVLLTDAGPVRTTMGEYLPQAVAAEMPAGFGAEALKAQAVAARTFVLACRRHGDADVCTSSGCCLGWLDEQALRERWGGDFARNMQAVRDAVAATDGEYLAYGGQAIQAAFHAGSIAATEDSGAIWSPLPYLVSVPSPETAENAPELVSTVTISPARLAGALALDPAGADPAGWAEPPILDDAGRVRTMTVLGKGFSGATLRSLLGLRSTAFTVDWDGSDFCFTVSGYGHGVGMSQTGAKLYAARGMSYRDILAHYYPGTELVGPEAQDRGSPSR